MQLAGMLLQGKFRELGIALGLGVISSAISAITDSVLQSVKDSLTKNGKFSLKNFSLKGVFSGAWKGLKTGLHEAFGRGWKSLIPIYGRYCGTGYPTGDIDDSLPGVDGLDNGVCLPHDKEYRKASATNSTKLTADRTFFKGLFNHATSLGFGDIIFNGRPLGGSVYRLVAIPSFGGLITYRKLK